MIGRFWRTLTGAYDIIECDDKLQPTDKIYPLHPSHDLSDADFNHIKHGQITGFDIVEEILDCGFHGSTIREFAKIRKPVKWRL